MDMFELSREVSYALNRNKPVVGLESSVFAQGLPQDAAMDVARGVMEAVRVGGAEPAVIGVLDGVVRVGLSLSEIESLVTGDSMKVTSRDLPLAAFRKLSGGTTVSATIRIASAAGISVAATGGIGGVHRGWSGTLDISADLPQLASTPILLVCSGIKAVLDVAATVEWLETYGVQLYGYQTDELPAFYSRHSGITVPRLEGAAEVADLARTARGAFGVRSAMIIAAPVPEADEYDANPAIEQALSEAEQSKISGKELTPFLLKRVAELTSGKSLAANISLLKNNARVAAEIACAIQRDTERRMGFMV